MEPVGLSSGRRLLLAALSAVAVANIYYAQPLLARIGADLAIPEQHVGWIVGIGQIGYLLGLVALVPLGDLANRRLLMAAHVASTAVGTGLIALSDTTVGVLAGAALAGLFSVVVQIAVAYAATVSGPTERGRDIGAVTSGVVVGILAARTVAGALADAAGWRAVYAASALASLALAGAVLALLPRDARQNRDRDRDREYLRAVISALRLPFSDRTFRSRALLCFFLFASFGTLWSGIALPLSDQPWNLSATEIGLFGIAGLTGALGAARAGRWADRGLATPVTGWSLLLLILSWTFTAQAPDSLPLLVIGVVALDFAVQAVHVTSQQLVTAGRPEAASRTIGAYMVFYSLGSALGAVSTTWAYSTAGWTLTSLLGAAYGVAALIVWAVSRHDARFAPSARRPVGAGALGRDVGLG